jgi:phosphoadenosine phosphosulfate reductase
MEKELSLIRKVLADHPGPACFTCSFQAEDVALLHLIRQVQPDIPVLFLETGYHFPETYAYRDQLTSDWKLQLVNLSAAQSVAEQESAFGLLYQSDPAACCRRRKVEPLFSALEFYKVWFTGLRREQSPSRAGLQEVETATLNSGASLLKVSPLAAWTMRDVEAYNTVHSIPSLPLYDMGYTSIGCAPCTAKPEPGANARSGRWGGAKLECGLHTWNSDKGDI